MWGSIVRATGFTPTFAAWWQQCDCRAHGSPETVPYAAPPWRVAERIFDTVMMAFRAFERDLFKASRLYARQRRESNPNMIFHDLGSYAPKGVDVLARSRVAHIQEVRTEEQALVFDAPVSFDPGHPVFCNGQEIEIIHHEDDCTWVRDVGTATVGMPVSQPSYLGAGDELFEAFLTAWRDMWSRHQNVPQDRWHDILSFAREHVPRGEFNWPPIDTSALGTCIAQKKKTTTAGLDGVTLQDLKAMPLDALTNFVDMFHHAEATGDWPEQVVAGRVTCIAKVEDPQHALDFRPITVLGLLYRCWGTYNAKQAIRMIDEVLPTGLFGSRQQCFAGQVWSQLLWTIELAYSAELPLSGIVADIRKAFNYLPRTVVFETCALLGLPFRVLRAWAGALTIMPRRFQINGALSRPTTSTCGLPEGCALSCVGMIAIDVLYHLWMRFHFPLCQPLSYVDDWQLLVPHPNTIQPVFACLDRLVQALDLYLDARKTCAWSLSSDGRALMREQGFTLVAYGRNLGAHVQFSRQHTNKTIMERISNVGQLWSRLRASPCPYHQKVRALLSAAWPRALHGIAATTLSGATYQTLRAGAAKGLKADGAGSNAHVHLGLIERAVVDPQCWAIIQTLRLTRDCGNRLRVESLLADLSIASITLPANTVTQTLLHRIQVLGWHVTPAGHILDFFGPFSLFEISMTELQYRVEFQWTQVVAQAVAHRPCFSGLSEVDPVSTRQWLQTLEASDRALFRLLLNGCHITQDGKHYCQQSSTDVCPFCDCSDSRFHRFWQCPAFDHLRTHITEDQAQVILDLPEVLTCSGWSLQPTTVYEWHEQFATLTLPVPAPILHTDQQTLHLFTDGSCHDQHDVARRFASFAVVRASVEGVHDYTGAEVLDSGPLPGLLQSAARAETFAILRSLQLVRNFSGRVMLWTDCESVVRKFSKLLTGHCLKVNGTHADLWLEIQQCLRATPATLGITKVAAHQSLERDFGIFQEWCFRHNSLADKHAVAANFRRTEAFWDLKDRHCRAQDNIGTLNRLVQSVLLAEQWLMVRARISCPKNRSNGICPSFHLGPRCRL